MVSTGLCWFHVVSTSSCWSQLVSLLVSTSLLWSLYMELLRFVMDANDVVAKGQLEHLMHRSYDLIPSSSPSQLNYSVGEVEVTLGPSREEYGYLALLDQ